jgi:hypothetical protein
MDLHAFLSEISPHNVSPMIQYDMLLRWKSQRKRHDVDMDEIRTSVWPQTAVRSSKIALCRHRDGPMGADVLEIVRGWLWEVS